MKRLVDVAVATSALVAAAPLMGITAVLIRLNLGSPVLFRQRRPGLHGRPFELIKFRTMRDTTDRDGKPLPDEKRLTWLGKLLRSTSIDELPELWNVVRGDMSLVGPRPLLMEYLELYSEEQARRHDVKPGITGLAQVEGRNALTWPERFELDVWYVDHWSLALDLQILVKTVATVLAREGISAPNSATMPNFQGER